MATNGNGSGGQTRNELMEIARILDENAQEAETRLRDYLTRNTGDVNATYLLAISLRLQERFDECLAAFGAVITAAPDFPAAQQELGITLQMIGHLDDAKLRLREAVRLEPRLAVAWKALGDVLAELGDNPGARESHQKFQELSQAQAGQSAEGISPLLQEAKAALEKGDVQKADQLCRNQLQTNPNDVWALRLLAEVGIRINAFGDAKNILESAVELEPDFHDARSLLANVLSYLNEYEEALEHLDILAEKRPGNPNNGAIKAKVLAELNEYETSLEIYHNLTHHYAKNPNVLLDYGNTLRAVGQHDEAIAAYREGIALEPGRGDLWFSLANLKTFQFSDEEVATMKSMLDGGNLSASNEAYLGFALGAAAEDAGEWDAAWQAFERGNKARRSFLPHEADDNTELTKAMKSTFTADYFAAHNPSGCDRPDPIFILGLPRSGSTLVEQVLASHSLVDGTMELPDINVLTRRIGGSTGPHVPSAYPQNMTEMGDEALKAHGEDYLHRAQPRRGSAPHFVDKMPSNFQHIGFIKAILPNAKIIDVRRAPMSTCYSLYKMSFNVGREYAYDLEDIARYYIDYIDLMDHWDTVLPGFVHRISYEDLVGNTEGEIRKLLDFCGLDFEDACLKPHETKRVVRTASSEQVRQPIYKDALEQWRHYEQHLEPLRKALAPLGGRFPLD